MHQIAIKHYGARGSLATKQALSPKLYDEIAAKLVGVWGQYAGWAHSVLFTADLKSFANYSTTTPSPMPSLIKFMKESPAPITADAYPSRRRKLVQTTSITIASSAGFDMKTQE